MSRRRRLVSACAAVLALGALASCNSQPSNRRVVRDVIESLQLPTAQEACMLERLEGYTDADLDAIAEENENWDPSGSGSTLADASEGMRLFIDDFAECTAEGGATEGSTATSEPTGSSAPTVSSEPAASSESTEPSASTEPTDSTETTTG